MAKDSVNTVVSSGHDRTEEKSKTPIVSATTEVNGLEEAGEIYGNLATAEQYGYVTRG